MAVPLAHGKGDLRRMKNSIRGVLVVAAMASAVTLSAQTANQSPQPTPQAQAAPESTPTADEIVSKYVAAIGGKEVISQVKTISTEGTMEAMGNEAPITMVLVDGVGMKSETDFNGQKIINCYSNKGSWMVNPMASASDPTPVPDEQAKTSLANIYVGGALYDYAAKGSKIELLGKNGDAYKVKLTTKDNADLTYLIDSTTFLIKTITIKAEIQGQQTDVTNSASDYRKTEVGLMLPYTMTIDYGGQFSLTINVKKVEFNKTIDPAVFEMPKPAEAPKPAA